MGKKAVKKKAERLMEAAGELAGAVKDQAEDLGEMAGKNASRRRVQSASEDGMPCRFCQKQDEKAITKKWMLVRDSWSVSIF